MISAIEMRFTVLPGALSADDQHKLAVEMATSRFMTEASNKGEMLPCFCAYCPNGVPGRSADPTMVFLVAPWGDEDEKLVILGTLRSAFADLGVSRYSFWSEAWFATLDAQQFRAMKTPVRLRDDRQEMLFVLTIDRDRPDILTGDFLIERPWDGGLPSLTPIDRSDFGGHSGLLVSLLGER
jgi:hypothetical protein